MIGELFEIRGRQGAGKTETIRLVWDGLLKRPGAQVELVNRGRGRREIKGGILNVDGVLVGIMSKSEPVESLLDVLLSLAESGCRVIVCATHGHKSKSALSKSAMSVYRFCVRWGWQRNPIRKYQGKYDDEEVAERVMAEVLAAVDRAQQLVGV